MRYDSFLHGNIQHARSSQYRPSRPFLSVALVSRLRAARARDALHSDARAGPSSSDSNAERESRRALASRRSGIASPRIANARTRPNLRLIDRRPNARTRPNLLSIDRDRSSTERAPWIRDVCTESPRASRSAPRWAAPWARVTARTRRSRTRYRGC